MIGVVTVRNVRMYFRNGYNRMGEAIKGGRVNEAEKSQVLNIGNFTKILNVKNPDVREDINMKKVHVRPDFVSPVSKNIV